MWPWPLTLKLVGIVARGVGNICTNFGISRTFCSQLIGQHLSDASCDLALTFDLRGHGACRRCGSSCSICVQTLNFVSLPIWKILGIYCVNPLGDLDLWPLNPKIVPLLGTSRSFIIYTKYERFGLICFWVMLRTNRQTDWLKNPTHADWCVKSEHHARPSTLLRCTLIK